MPIDRVTNQTGVKNSEQLIYLTSCLAISDFSVHLKIRVICSE